MSPENPFKMTRWILWIGVAAGFFLMACFSGTLHAKTLKLNEEDVIIIVLRQNLGVLSQSFDPKIAETFVEEVKSRFDIFISGQAFYQLDQSDKQSIVFGTDNRTLFFDGRAEKRFPYGIQGALKLSNQRDTTNSAFATDPAFYETILGFEVRGNLLKNRWGKSDRGEVKAAETEVEVVRQESLNAVEDQVYRAVLDYWSLVAAYYYLDLAKEFRGYAQQFLDVTQEKRVIGLSEDPDILAAEVQVIKRDTEILRAKNLIEDFEQRLKNSLDLRSSVNLRPKDRLHWTPKKVGKNEIFTAALANRNDYQALLKEAMSKDIQIVVAKDQTLPTLDLFTSLELNSVDPNYGTVLAQTFSGQNPEWTVGLEFGLNFENRLAKSNLQKKELEKAKLLVEIKRLENQIALNIDESYREYFLQNKEAANAARGAVLEKKKLDIEMENYLMGRSSSDIIVRFQQDYLDAEKVRLDSELRQRTAWVDLRRTASVLIPEKLKEKSSETRRMVRKK